MLCYLSSSVVPPFSHWAFAAALGLLSLPHSNPLNEPMCPLPSTGPVR